MGLFVHDPIHTDQIIQIIVPLPSVSENPAARFHSFLDGALQACGILCLVDSRRYTWFNGIDLLGMIESRNGYQTKELDGKHF
jgi:hypothetical protein